MKRIVGKSFVCTVICGLLLSASAEQPFNLIPWPKALTAGSGLMVLTERSRITCSDARMAPLADVLAEDIWRLTGLRLKTAQGTAAEGDILLKLDAALKGEAYTVSVTDRAVVSGGNYQACALGEATLVQLLHREGAVSLPKVTIQDQPDNEYRGTMLDLARRWHPVETLKDTIELLRLYKIKYLHLHLSDNESFVFPSRSLPELATPKRSYSLAEMREIVRFADERGVVIIPEIDVPGHAGSWIGKRPDIFGTTDPVTGKARSTGVLNMASEKAYEGMDALVKDMCDIFTSSPYIHLGTDETSADGLKKLPEYKTYTEKYNLTNAAAGRSHELMCHFIVRMNECVKRHGRQMIKWDLPSSTSVVKTPADITVMIWSGSPEAGLKQGFKTINTCWIPLYIVPPQGRAQPADVFYAWNSRLINHYGRDKPLQLPSVEKNLIGAQLCVWEQRYNEVIPLLRPRASAMSERLWNAGAGKTFANFQGRFASVDRMIESILYPVAVEAVGVIEPNEERFTDTVTVKLTSVIPGTIRYTLSKPWEILSSALNQTYSQPLTLEDTMTVSAQLFSTDGKPVGGILQKRFSKIVPAYTYRLLGPTPSNGWRDMPNFSKLTELGAGVTGLMTRDRAEQINRSMFAGLSEFGHIEVRIPGLWNPRTLELKGRLQLPEDGAYEFKIKVARGQAELAFDTVTIASKGGAASHMLTRGVYPFTIKYYNNGVFNDLNIQVKGPGMATFQPFEKLVLPLSDTKRPGAQGLEDTVKPTPPSCPRRLLASEPFDYPTRVYPAGNWAGLSGSGVGWSSRGYSDHTKTACNFIVGGEGPAGGYFESEGQNNPGSYWRNRMLSPAIHDNNAGKVTWQSMLFWSDGSKKGGGMIVHNMHGGTVYNIRLTKENVYQLVGGHNNTQGTTQEAVSTRAASTDPKKPDFLLFKIENHDEAGLQTVALWINPAVSLGETGLPKPCLSVSFKGFSGNRTISGINLSPGAVKMDEILFGKTFKDVTVGVPPAPPCDPLPADRATEVSVTKSLRWGNADADSYKVFFWENAQPRPDAPAATVTVPFYEPPVKRKLNTAYAWSVILVKGEHEVAGPQWLFQTGGALPPGPAAGLCPGNASSDIPVSTSLSWGEALRATSYNVYLWPASQARPKSPTGCAAVPHYKPSALLAYGTDYRWQIEAVNDFGTNATSEVWSFTVERLVNSPLPVHGATNMLVWAPLTWAEVPGTESFDVYLWKKDSTRPSTPSGTVTASRYVPGSYLDDNTVYNWQVVARVTGGGTVSGPVWSFATHAKGEGPTAPPYDISPDAQALRTSLYTIHGRATLSGKETPLKEGMKLSFYGDSITWQNNYINAIGQALKQGEGSKGLNIRLINHGVNGGGALTLLAGDKGKNHFANTQPRPFAETLAEDQPTVAVIFIGINDVWWRKTSPKDFEQALTDMVAFAKANKVRPVLATLAFWGDCPTSRNANNAKADAYAELTRKVARATGATLVDLRKACMAYLMNNSLELRKDGSFTFAERGVMSGDGVHPNGKGVQVIAELISQGIFIALKKEQLDAAECRAKALDAEKAGKQEEALTAWERVIDRCPATEEQRLEAREHIKKLRTKVPRNMDPAKARAWKTLVVIFRTLDFSWTNKKGEKIAATKTINAVDEKKIRSSIEAFRNHVFRFSSGMLRIDADIRVIDVPLTNLYGKGEGPFQISPHIVRPYIAPLLKQKRYDTLFAYVKFNEDQGPRVPAAYTAATFGRLAEFKNAGYIMVPWHTNYPYPGETDGEMEIHEWLHQIDSLFAEVQRYQNEIVQNPDAGRRENDGRTDGDTEYMRKRHETTWIDFYRHLMEDHITRQMWSEITIDLAPGQSAPGDVCKPNM